MFAETIGIDKLAFLIQSALMMTECSRVDELAFAFVTSFDSSQLLVTITFLDHVDVVRHTVCTRLYFS